MKANHDLSHAPGAFDELSPAAKKSAKWKLVWLVLVASWVLVSFVLSFLVAAIYDGDLSGGWFSNVMTNRSNLSLGDYQAVVWRYTSAAHLILLILLVIVRTWSQRSPRLTLLMLLAGDLMLLTLSYLYRGWLTVAHDWGLPEIYQYTKELGIAFGFFWLLRKRPTSRVFGALAVLFVWFFIDDAAMYHEIVGAALVNYMDLQPLADMLGGVRPQDVGEVLSLIAPASILAVILALGYRQSDLYGRQVCHRIIGMIALLVFFGVIVDTADHLPALQSVIIEVAHFEDGGEMWVMSMIAAYTATLIWANSPPPQAEGQP